MPEQTTSTIEIDAPPERVMAVIVDFEDYPTWVQGMKRVEIVERGPDGRAEQVHFALDAGVKDSYPLAYDYADEHTLRWRLVEGKLMRAMDGTYELTANDAGTHVTYRLAVDLAIPMIGMLRRKAEKVIIDTALKGLKKRVESLG
jgi:ribosome-associated toxin RatA of RatAB toxin-antitoxin module